MLNFLDQKFTIGEELDCSDIADSNEARALSSGLSEDDCDLTVSLDCLRLSLFETLKRLGILRKGVEGGSL